MSKKNIKLVGIASIAILSLAGVGFIGLPIVNQTGTWKSESTQVEDSNAELSTHLTSLSKVKEEVGKIQTINDELAVRFPNLPRGTDLLQNISLAAGAAGIGSDGIEAIAITAPVLIIETAAEAAPAEGDAAATDKAAEEAPADGAAPAEAAAPTSNVASMDVSLSIKGSSEQILAFTREFNNMSRTIKVKTASISGAAEDGSVKLAIAGIAYLYISIEPPTEDAAQDAPAEDTTVTK